jgi:hypothetical protein
MADVHLIGEVVGAVSNEWILLRPNVSNCFWVSCFLLKFAFEFLGSIVWSLLAHASECAVESLTISLQERVGSSWKSILRLVSSQALIQTRPVCLVSDSPALRWLIFEPETPRREEGNVYGADGRYLFRIMGAGRSLEVPKMTLGSLHV